MNSELHLIWQEILSDLSSRVVLWQLFAIAVSVGLAWVINRSYKGRVLQRSTDTYKSAVGGFNRILFPISALVFLWLAKIILKAWMHVGLLQLATKLFLAMAVVRLLVYAIRYIFNPSGWLKTLEQVIVWSIWSLLALHLTGLMQTIAELLESVAFNVGKNRLNLLILGQGLFTVIITILIALWVSRLVENKLMRAEQVSINVRVVIAKLIRISFLLVAVLTALSAVGLDITFLSVFGGALGVGLGLGLQKIASNYVSGFILLLDKSMKIGDKITVDKHVGVIRDMRTRYMLLDKQDGTNVIIPNEILITTTVINHSLTDNISRVEIPLRVSAESPLEKAMALMKEVANNHASVMALPQPEVLIKGILENGIDLELRVWTNDLTKGQLALQSEMYQSILHVFRQHEILLSKSCDQLS
jgi:small-conductance mechanosensitive channel